MKVDRLVSIIMILLDGLGFLLLQDIFFCRVLDIRVTEIMEPHIPKIPCNPIAEILQFPQLYYPRYLYTSSEFSPLSDAKNMKNRPEKLQLSQKFRKPRRRR